MTKMLVHVKLSDHIVRAVVAACQSAGVDADSSTEERQVVAGVEAVPERAEQEHGKRTATTLVDDVA